MENIPYELIARHFAGECNDDETRQLQEWSRQHPELMDEFSKIWEQVPTEEFTPDAEQALRKVHLCMDAKKTPAKRRILMWVGSAAAVALIIIVSLIAVRQMSTPKDFPPETLLTLETNAAETLEYTLPDGSRIWLNCSSVVHYPEEFATHTREVQLQGEAFFDIAPDADKPFLIRANGTLTRVVGTSFGIRAVEGADEVIVTVSTGIINFSADGKEEKIELKQGEQGICRLEEQKLEKNENPDPNLLAWKTRLLVFKQTPLPQVAQLVQEVYGTPISVDPSVADLQLNSTFDQLSLDEILQIIEMTLQIRARKDNNGILLTR